MGFGSRLLMAAGGLRRRPSGFAGHLSGTNEALMGHLRGGVEERKRAMEMFEREQIRRHNEEVLAHEFEHHNAQRMHSLEEERLNKAMGKIFDKVFDKAGVSYSPQLRKLISLEFARTFGAELDHMIKEGQLNMDIVNKALFVAVTHALKEKKVLRKNDIDAAKEVFKQSLQEQMENRRN